MKIIYDKIWGEIEMSDLSISIIDTPMYHRMSYIKQTSMAYRVFPTATHTRFNHQIGVYGLLKKTLNVLISKGHLIINDYITPLTPEEMTRRVNEGTKPSITKDEYEWICLGGLLHDLGHGPASHTFDDLIEELVVKGLITNTKWRTHEERSQELFRNMIDNDNIKISQEGVEYICNIINPPITHHHDFRFQFVNNEVNGIDVDKMDYICRDCMVFGIASHVNIERIIDNSSIVYDSQDDTNAAFGTYWSFGERIRNEVFNLFMMRYQLYRDIYNHPKVIKFEIAYKAVLYNNIDALLECFNKNDIQSFIEMTDESIYWRASTKVRKEFTNRNTYELVPNGTLVNPIVIEETVGFFGKCGFNPFQHIRFHDRNSCTSVIRIPLSQINIFLCYDCTCEVLRYEYKYNKLS
jgi:HD superfamily phosphohydrolase